MSKAKRKMQLAIDNAKYELIYAAFKEHGFQKYMPKDGIPDDAELYFDAEEDITTDDTENESIVTLNYSWQVGPVDFRASTNVKILYDRIWTYDDEKMPTAVTLSITSVELLDNTSLHEYYDAQEGYDTDKSELYKDEDEDEDEDDSDKTSEDTKL